MQRGPWSKGRATVLPWERRSRSREPIYRRFITSHRTEKVRGVTSRMLRENILGCDVTPKNKTAAGHEREERKKAGLRKKLIIVRGQCGKEVGRGALYRKYLGHKNRLV